MLAAVLWMGFFFGGRSLIFQKVGQRKIDRKDHVWVRLEGGVYKCVLCGGMARQPPGYPTPRDWLPTKYEPLTDEERALCPGKGLQ